MATRTNDLSIGRNLRIELHTPGFLIPAPDAPWIECTIVDVSQDEVCLDVGAMAVPELFGLAFTASGEVLRICSLLWRRGERIGARFVTAKELRQSLAPNTGATTAFSSEVDFGSREENAPKKKNGARF